MEVTNETGKNPAGAQSSATGATLSGGLCADDFEISRFRDGALVLSCGKDGMESDLVFASGAMMDEDPILEKQKKILEFILAAVHNSKLTGRAKTPETK